MHPYDLSGWSLLVDILIWLLVEIALYVCTVLLLLLLSLNGFNIFPLFFGTSDISLTFGFCVRFMQWKYQNLL